MNSTPISKKKCKFCSTIINDRYRIFCNNSCSAKFNNRHRQSCKSYSIKTVKCIACDTLVNINAHASKSYCDICRKTKLVNNIIVEERCCVGCYKQFTVRKYAKTRFCSSKCWSSFTRRYKDDFIAYREKCKFKFDVREFPEKFDISLLDKYG